MRHISRLQVHSFLLKSLERRPSQYGRNKNIKMPPKRRMGPPGRGMAPVEKAKDFKGSIGKLIRYIGSYRLR